MEPSEDTKPLPALIHMPPHIKKEIGENLEHFDKIALRNANRDFRRDIRPPPIIAVLRMVHDKENRAQLKFFCKNLGVSKKKTYEKNEMGWMVKTNYKLNDQEHESTVQGGEDLGELLIEDFKSILAIPMLTFRLFDFVFNNSAEYDIMPRITHILSHLGPKLKVENLTLGSDKQEEILGILPFVNPDVLKLLVTGKAYMGKSWPAYDLQDLQLHRFPNLEHIDVSNLTGFVPVEIWWNIPSVDIGLDYDHSSPESLAELPRILQHFRQTPGVSSLGISGGESTKQALGPVGPLEEEKYFHLPAEGANLEVFGTLWDHRVILTRRDPDSDDEEEDEEDDDLSGGDDSDFDDI